MMDHILYQLFDPRGRLRRMDYFKVTVALCAVRNLYVMSLSGEKARAMAEGRAPHFSLAVELSVYAVIFLVWLPASVRRLHDADRTGWWTLLVLPSWAAAQIEAFARSPLSAHLLPTVLRNHLFDIQIAGWVAWGVMLLMLYMPSKAGETRFETPEVIDKPVRVLPDPPRVRNPAFDFLSDPVRETEERRDTPREDSPNDGGFGRRR
ncbi:MAG: DUF805 domain-containing protein [Asticcacaulis sp.]|nr:DUF805 domain-containing protein [Asticcacaulis sp.]